MTINYLGTMAALTRLGWRYPYILIGNSDNAYPVIVAYTTGRVSMQLFNNGRRFTRVNLLLDSVIEAKVRHHRYLSPNQAKVIIECISKEMV